MSKTPIRARIMSEGIVATTQSRNKAYGDPIVNLTAAGDLKQTMRKHLRRQDLPVGALEALDNVLQKIARIITGPGYHPDNYVDGSTYFAIAGEIDETFTMLRIAEQEGQAAEQIEDDGARAIAEALAPTAAKPLPPDEE